MGGALLARGSDASGGGGGGGRDDGGDDDVDRGTTGIRARQRHLLEYARTLLLDDDGDAPPTPGSSSHERIVRISNCIDAWISTGEMPHRHPGRIGFEQATALAMRLVAERGGGNADVTWEMLRLPSLVRCLGALHSGRDFVDRAMSIVGTFEREYHRGGTRAPDDYGNDDGRRDGGNDDGGGGGVVGEGGWGGGGGGDGSNAATLGGEEVPYKSIIATLCELRTSHAAAAAELALDRFESRLLAGGRGYGHPNPPTTETYNNVMSCWVRSGAGCGALGDYLDAPPTTTTRAAASPPPPPPPVVALRVPPEPVLQPAPADAGPVPLGPGRDGADEARLPVVQLGHLVAVEGSDVRYDDRGRRRRR